MKLSILAGKQLPFNHCQASQLRKLIKGKNRYRSLHFRIYRKLKEQPRQFISSILASSGFKSRLPSILHLTWYGEKSHSCGIKLLPSMIAQLLLWLRLNSREISWSFLFMGCEYSKTIFSYSISTFLVRGREPINQEIGERPPPLW